MNLTPENKAAIDAKSYQALLAGVRFSPVGDRWFQGETGDYWLKRMSELRAAEGGDAKHVAASKSLGW
jgi:hypothetical protein